MVNHGTKSQISSFVTCFHFTPQSHRAIGVESWRCTLNTKCLFQYDLRQPPKSFYLSTISNAQMGFLYHPPTNAVYAHFSMWDGKNVNNQSQMHTNCLSLNSMYSAYWKYVSILQLLVSPFVFLRFTVECSTILGHHSPIPGDQYERWGYQAARLHLLIRCKQRKDIYYWWFRNPAFTSWGW